MPIFTNANEVNKLSDCAPFSDCRLVHDVFDNVEFDAEQYDDDDNFECNKENDAQFTWDFPINSSNLFHSSNISLESLNMKNTVKSKLGSKKIPLQEQIRKHNADMVETVCGLRIEDFAKVGTNCARLNLDSVVSRKNSKKQQTVKSLGRTDSSNQEQLNQTDESIASVSLTAMFCNVLENHLVIWSATDIIIFLRINANVEIFSNL